MKSQGGEHCLYAVGHMALAYLLGKSAAKALHEKVNVPILLVLSILPDIDIIYDFFTGTEIHRGPTHSIISIIIIFIPIFILLRKKAVPYFLAMISHPILSDFIAGGQLQLLWPITNQEFGLHELGGPYIDITDPANLALELSLFAVATVILFASGDWKVFFSNQKTNLVLIIPIATVLLPSTLGYPFTMPLILTSPILALAHLFYLVLFTIAVVKALIPLVRRLFGLQTKNPPPKLPG
ncbi:MAG: metal-dependent hydrolase [Candidatus Bathyarchaeota archaeon]|nr:metal-dependent hydrolase [Candidatus Bathyarchaeota archaeon]